jgi:hypothetical protein
MATFSGYVEGEGIILGRRQSEPRNGTSRNLARDRQEYGLGKSPDVVRVHAVAADCSIDERGRPFSTEPVARDHSVANQNPQRLYARPEETPEDTVRAAWRHAESGRNVLALERRRDGVRE